MGDFKKSSFSDRKKSFGGKPGGFGGKPSFGGPKRFGGDRPSFGRGGDRPQGFKTTCDQCGKSCEVPFRPNGDKPVYCNDCFGDKRDSFNEFDRKPSRDSRDGGYEKKRDYPTTQSARPGVDNIQFADLKKQMELMNSKLDRLVSALSNTPAPKAEKPTETLKEVVKKASAPVVAEKPAKKEVKKEVKKTVAIKAVKIPAVKKAVAPKAKKEAKPATKAKAPAKKK